MAWYNQNPVKTVKSAGSKVVAGATKALTDPAGAAKDVYEYGKDVVTDKNPYAQVGKAAVNVAQGDYADAAGNLGKAAAYGAGGMIGGKIGGAIGGSAVGGAIGGAAAPIAGQAIGTAIGGRELGVPIKDGVSAGVQAVGNAAIDAYGKIKDAVTPPGPSAGAGGAASGLTADLLNRLNNTAPRLPPTVRTPNLGQPPTSQAVTLQGVDPVKATTVDPAAVGNVTAAQAQLPPAAIAQMALAERAKAAMINQDPANQSRGKMMGLVGRFEDYLNGNGPSAAEALFRSKSDDALQTQLALARSARGGNLALAQRMAGRNMAVAGQQAANDAAMLRAGEMERARTGLSGLLSSLRGQDIDVATSQAGFENATNLANARAGTDVNLANARAGTDVNLANMREAGETGRFNAGQTNTVEVGNRNRLADILTKNADLTTGVDTANANRLQQLNLKQGEFEQGSRDLAAKLAADYATKGADLEMQAGIADAANQLKAQGMDDDKIRVLLDNLVATRGQDLADARGQDALELERWKAKWGLAKDGVSGLSSLLATLGVG